MYDLNFFSILKREKQKNKSTKIVIFGVLAFILLANALLIGFGLITFNKLESKIELNQAYIDSTETKNKVREAMIASKEAAIANEYLNTVKNTATQIRNVDIISVDLLDYLTNLLPASTYTNSLQINELNIILDCVSSNQTDPILFYNRLLEESRFTSVVMPGISSSENGLFVFSIRLTLKGGDQR